MRLRVLSGSFCCVVVAAGCLWGQGRPVDWASFGGDAQRTGWEKSDTRITKENVKDFELVWKRKFEGSGARALTPPVVVGMLISYKGFKELGILADSSGGVAAVDLDLNRVFWQKKLGAANGSCSNAGAVMPALVPPTTFGGAKGAKPAAKRPAIPGNSFGQPRPVFVVSADGKLHKLHTSSGEDMSPPMDFLPAHSGASPLTIHDGAIYASTTAICGAKVNTVSALDLTAASPKAVTFTWEGGGASVVGGPAFGSDGTLYVQTGPGTSKMSSSVLALTPLDLKLKSRFQVPSGAAKSASTPVVFAFQGHDVLLITAADGRLVLLDAGTLGSLSQTEPLFGSPAGTWGGALASWEDAAGARWVLAPVGGGVNPAVAFPTKNGEVSRGAVLAFKVEDQNGKPTLTPAWVSRDMATPGPPVITSGVVFALAAGDYRRPGAKPSGHATLYALDAATGKEMYTSGSQVTTPGTLTGLTLANGRVFFTTIDSTLWAFGIHLEI